MNILWQRFLFCTLTVFAGLVFSQRAYATNYEYFYEISKAPNAPIQECNTGKLSVIKNQLVTLVNYSHEGSKFNLICIPKWYLIDENDKSKVLLIPYTSGQKIDPTILDYRITNALKDLIQSCSETEEICIDTDRKESKRQYFVQKAYLINSTKRLTYFKRQLSDANSFYEELKALRLPALTKLIQVRLNSLGYNPGPIDGAPGDFTSSALNQWFDDASNSESNAHANLFVELMKPVFLDIQEDASHADASEDAQGTVSKPPAEPAAAAANGESSKDATQGKISNDVDNHETATVEDEVKLRTHDAAQNLNLQIELQTLKDQHRELENLLQEQQDLYLRAENEKNTLLLQLQSVAQEPISVFWSNKVQKELRIIGENPLKKEVELKISESLFSELSCILTASNSLEQQYEENLKRNRCFRVTLKEYDEDTDSNRTYDAVNKVLTIPVLEKQSDVIRTISVEGLENFEDKDAPSCYVGLKLNNEENANDVDASKDKIIQLFLTVSGDEQSPIIQLTDAGMVAKEKYQWENSTFELVDLTPEGETSSCLISTGDTIPIIKKVENPKDNAQVALVYRNGDVVLKNLKLVKKEEPELHVFMDTLVGPEGDEDYGFNPALVDLSEQETQKIYFEGFLKGVQAFLVENKGIGKLTVHHTIMNKNKETIKVAEFRRSDDPLSEHLLLPDEFIETYINSFAAGVEGTFDNKKRDYSRILDANGNSLFVAFGSSGAKPDRVCQTERKREDYGDNTLIFDVVPAYTFDQLDEDGVVTTLKRGFYLKCKNYGGIAVLRPRGNRESKDVQDVVMDHLSANWRY